MAVVAVTTKTKMIELTTRIGEKKKRYSINEAIEAMIFDFCFVLYDHCDLCFATASSSIFSVAVAVDLVQVKTASIFASMLP